MFPGKAKSVIVLFMFGGISQVDSFDRKRELDRHDGKQMTAEIVKKFMEGELMLFSGKADMPLMRSPFAWKKYGGSGIEVSELFPNVGACVDDLCFVRSLYGDNNNHAPSCFQVNTGYVIQGFPSVGSWVTYALGSQNQDLPAYVVMTDRGSPPVGGATNWTSGFLPAAYQGTLLRSGDVPILDLNPPAELPEGGQRAALDLLERLNREHLRTRPGDSDLEARIDSYELAYRMQAAAPEAVDLSQESPETLRLYGLDVKETENFGRKCLLARRFVERGVRFVQLYSGNGNSIDWDAHAKIEENHRKRALEVDRPIAGLIKDLKRRGLLDQTLVVFVSEFGRMPITQGNGGRDHNPDVQTAWFAGGGTRGGTVVGASDEVGYKAAEKPYHIRDLHATILGALGIDDKKLTYYFNGRHFRLTDTGGQVIREALA
jgi:hypothetical protein